MTVMNLDKVRTYNWVAILTATGWAIMIVFRHGQTCYKRG